MEKIKIRIDFERDKLVEMGYRFVMIEGGFVSNNNGTIITTDRLGHKREVLQYKKNLLNEHLVNVAQLRQADLIE